jgi:hypothetical protein
MPLRIATFNIRHGLGLILPGPAGAWRVVAMEVIDDAFTSDHRPVRAALESTCVVAGPGRGLGNAVDFLSAPSAADGQVGRGCQYPTPAASSARDRQVHHAATQNEKVTGIGGLGPP